jgi:NADH-quinone oxidoreductase subunit E
MARLTAENTQRALDLIALYPQARSALIPMLHVAQEQDGYLTDDAMTQIGELIGLTGAEVRGTASFYDMLFLEPVGRYLLSVCTNIACLLNGGVELLEHVEQTLGVRAGGTTNDGTFTVEEVECIALCGNAPCLTANWRFFGDVTPARFDTLVEDLRMGRLAEDVPPHGTLCRVRRSVGLQADVPAKRSGPAPLPDAPAPPLTQPHGSDKPEAPPTSEAQPGSPKPGQPQPGSPDPVAPDAASNQAAAPEPATPEAAAPEAAPEAAGHEVGSPEPASPDAPTPEAGGRSS